MTNFPKIIFLTGPTATGKTALALEICQKLPCEIISVDSAMVYRGMTIGTGKPTKDILATIPHHLIDICEPSETYSAAQFRIDALRAIEDILMRGKIPLLVGGTMLYLKTLRDGIAALPVANEQIRQDLLAETKVHGLTTMHERLTAIDPIAAQKIHPNDPQRILRALEVYALTGKNLSNHFDDADPSILPYNYHQIALIPADRHILHERIAHRFHQMLAAGFLDEVSELRRRTDLNPDLPSMRSVGYRQAWTYLDGKMSYDDMIERSIIATRQLAKRQLTWLRSWPKVHYFNYAEPNLARQICQSITEFLV